MASVHSSSAAAKTSFFPGPEIITLYPQSGEAAAGSGKRKFRARCSLPFGRLRPEPVVRACRMLLTFFLASSAILLISGLLSLSEGIGPAAADVGENDAHDEYLSMIRADRDGYRKYYTSVPVRSGDTLWSIAREYNRHSGMTDEEYVDELRHMNSISGLDIHAGHYLTVCYFR